MAVAERTFAALARGRARERTGEAALALPLTEIALGVAIFAIAMAVYNATLTPSLSYESFDGNELATVPYQMGLAHSTGYPLYTWAGKLFTFLPIGDVAHRINLMSAAGAAGGSALLFAIVVMLARDGATAGRDSRSTISRWLPPAAGAFGALMFAFSTALWSQAVIAEVYAPNVFMLGLAFALILAWGRHERRSIVSGGRGSDYEADGRSLALFGAFALSFGLGLGMHMSNLALAPGFVAFILLTNWRLALQPKFVLMGAAGFGLGALQFAWLPYKSANINDSFLARNTPNDLEGIYNYTLNAFPQFKWAFPLSAIPDRVVLYLDFLGENFRWPGVALAVVGGLGMGLRNPRAFFLFAPGYVAEMAFFLEYRVSDLDVFYIPSHFIVAVFIGYGAWVVADAAFVSISHLRRTAPTPPPPGGAAGTLAAGSASSAERAELVLRHPFAARLGIAALGLLLLAIAVQPAVSLARGWDDNDQSENTGINDFYEVVFETLPQNSVLVGRGGVFGYDMFYWRYVYNLRPDVDIPLARGFNITRAQQQGRTFTVAPPGSQGTANVGPGASPRGLQSSNSWYWPLIAAPVQTDDGGFQLVRQLTLYEARTEAPQLFVSGVTPQHAVNQSFGSITLAGYDVDSSAVERGGTVHLKLYWQASSNARPQIGTKVGDTEYFEAHELGFGNLQRLSAAQRTGSMIVEEYDLVILSSLDRGEQPFRIRVSGGAFGQSQSDWLEVGTLVVR